MRAAVLGSLLVAVTLAVSACGSNRSAQTTTTTTTTTTPVVRPVPAGFAPAELSATSASDLWLLGSARCATASCAALVHSADGGGHFASVNLPPARAKTLDSVRFASADDGYVYDGHAFGRGAPLWETSDAGAHWHRAPFDDLLAFGLGAGEALAVSAICVNGNCHDLELRTAPLGTDTWTTTSIATSPVDPIVAITVRGSSIWLSVSDTSSTQPNQALLYSSNGGQTFALEKSPCVTGLGGSLAASSAKVVWATCPTGMLATAYRTDDAGATWSTVNVGRELANSSQLVPASDSTAVLATGDQAQLLRTIDGGGSFSVVQPVTAGYWNRIEFADATHGFALRIAGTGQPSPKLYASDDDGATWRVVAVR